MVTSDTIAHELAAAIDGDEVAQLRIVVRALAAHLAMVVVRLPVDDPGRAGAVAVAQAALDHLDGRRSYFDFDVISNTRH